MSFLPSYINFSAVSYLFSVSPQIRALDLLLAGATLARVMLFTWSLIQVAAVAVDPGTH